MPSGLPEGYELDDDPGRIDVDAVHRFVTEAYWAKGRSRQVVAAAIAGSARVVGLYHDGEQVGFARVVSDGQVIAYLADVYVLEEHRGHGLGQAVVQAAVEGSDLGRCRWLPQTSGSQTLYERFGFASLTDGRAMGRFAPSAPAHWL
jgi:GNAT superfamily N-acetyltransferase